MNNGYRKENDSDRRIAQYLADRGEYQGLRALDSYALGGYTGAVEDLRRRPARESRFGDDGDK